ncbi:TetR/AcrR family transcriptional regulator [Nonomuraea typhae]|uniref:TetR/AcrR family transcriptional regulator n=1 Tax=Nonomuraea typhae TaxID=2603600 RepID=UPI0012FAEF07|nr:TetR/AcrR family transcriptional regulator [Nonomuraea typhae]
MAHVPAAERRPQLVEAAIGLMAREGVAAGSTRAIAAEAGVAQAMVHYMFGSKQELYRGVLEELIRTLVSRVEAAMPEDGTDFRETIAALVRELWRTVTEEREKYILFLELTLLSLRDPVLRKAASCYTLSLDAIAARLLTEAAERAGQPLALPAEVVARYFISGFDGIVLRFLEEEDPGPAAAILEHFLDSTVALATGRI